MKRNKSLDIAKGIGIYIVVLAHTCSQKDLVNFIYLFHMPLFFFISGVISFYSKKITYKEFLKKKIKSLIIPYLIFSIFSFLYWFIIERKIRNQTEVSALDVLGNVFICKADEKLYLPNVVLWFLPCLFVAEIIFYYIKKVKKPNILILVILVSGYIFNINETILPFGTEIALIATVFMYTGFLYASRIDENRDSQIVKIIGLFFSIIGITLCMYLRQKTNLLNHQYGNIILFFIGAYSGINIIMNLSNAICKIENKITKILSYFGKNSLIIMLCHEPIKRIILKITSIIFKITVDVLRKKIFYSNIVTTLILLSIVPIIFVINKYFPIIIGKYNIKCREN